MKQVAKSRRMVLNIAVTGVMTGLVMAFTFIGINLGSAYVNLGDAMVLTAGALFGPAVAAIAGGLGAMLADLIVFPATFAFTLVIKAVEGAVCGALIKYVIPKVARKHISLQVALGVAAMVLSAVIMATGYFGTNVLFWGEGDSPATRLAGATLQLPIDILQGVIGCVIAILLTYVIRLDKIAARFNVGSLLLVRPQKENRPVETADAEKSAEKRENSAPAPENTDGNLIADGGENTPARAERDDTCGKKAEEKPEKDEFSSKNA
mgnify:FL=1